MNQFSLFLVYIIRGLSARVRILSNRPRRVLIPCAEYSPRKNRYHQLFFKNSRKQAKVPDLYYRPVIRKRKNIRCSICCMESAAMKKNG